jgi:hypothetical protein
MTTGSETCWNSDNWMRPTRHLTGLFSKQNLDAQMDVGFKGNPNIGSVVLNRFYNSREFRIFAGNFREG